MFQPNCPDEVHSRSMGRGVAMVPARAHSEEIAKAERHANQCCKRLADIDLGARDKEPDLDDLQASLSPRLSKLR